MILNMILVYAGQKVPRTVRYSANLNTTFPERYEMVQQTDSLKS